MGTKKISELEELENINDNDLLAIVDNQNNTTKKVKVKKMSEYVNNYPVQIPASDFFDSVASGINIHDFYCYKIGCLINIQRVWIDGLTADQQTIIGVIKNKYLPKCGKTVRWIGNNGGQTEMYFQFIDGNGELNATTSGTALYTDNITYICKGE